MVDTPVAVVSREPEIVKKKNIVYGLNNVSSMAA